MLSIENELRPITVLVALLAALSLAAFGCAEKKEQPKGLYKIGAVLSLSGTAAPLGQPEQKSLSMLEGDINAKGGINSRNVQFLIEDDESDPAKATTAVAKLIKQEGVDAVIGGSTTGATLAMSIVAEKEQIPLVCCAAGTQITHPVKKWVFRTPPTYTMAIEKVLGYLKEGIEVTKVAVLHDSNAFGKGGADELKAKSPSYGIQVIAQESYGPRTWI